MNVGRRARRWFVLSATASAVAIGLTGCSPAATSGQPGSAAGTPSASPTPAPAPAITLSDTAAKISYTSPVTLKIAHGSFTSVQVSTTKDNQILEGDVSADGTSWVSQMPPTPDVSYSAQAVVKDGAGKALNQTVSFEVKAIPDNRRVSFTVTPDDGATVGIGQPIVVRFLTAVTERATMEKVMTVDARTSAGKDVIGSWHWLNSQEVDWRPKDFWSPGTKVSLDMKIAGVKAAKGRYGRKDYSQDFTIGASHITRVDASTHRIKVYRDGKLMNTWLTGTGRRGLETYSGTYIVLGKSPEVQMDSCSARITCDKRAPDYYDEKEFWATRITASGTFLHAASWDGQLGRANVSHGCIHLSDANAKTFYSHAVNGDVVIVSHSGRGPQERIATQDPGLHDWNLSWSAWTKGSALD